MKNTKLMRRLSLVALAMLLVCAATFTASAAYDWEDGDYRYGGTVTNTASIEKTQRSPYSATHTYGTSTTFSPTRPANYTQVSNGGYRDEYEVLLNAYGFASSVDYYLNLNDSCRVRATEASGRYYLTVVFPGNSLRLQVTRLIDHGNGNTSMDYRETQTSSYVPKMNAAHVDYTAG